MRKSIGKKRLIKTNEVDRNQNLVLDEDVVKIKVLFEKLHKKYGNKSIELIRQLDQEEFVPLILFSNFPSPLESLCYYLHIEKNKTFNEIGKTLDRSEKTIWQAYNSAKKKLTSNKLPNDTNKVLFETKDEKFQIPLSIFSDRSFSVLENLCIYLRDNFNLKYSQIAELLKKDQRTIWTCCSRADKKLRDKFR